MAESAGGGRGHGLESPPCPRRARPGAPSACGVNGRHVNVGQLGAVGLRDVKHVDSPKVETLLGVRLT